MTPQPERHVARHVLLAIDETRASERAAEFVHRFFGGEPDTRVVAVNVARGPIMWGAPPPYGWVVPYGVASPWPWAHRGDDPASVVDLAADEEEHARAVAAAHAPPGARPEAEFGDPAEAIMRSAENEDVDLIVVGSNHKGLLGRLIEPSVSRRLVHEAPKPVLVVG